MLSNPSCAALATLRSMSSLRILIRNVAGASGVVMNIEVLTTVGSPIDGFLAVVNLGLVASKLC